MVTLITLHACAAVCTKGSGFPYIISIAQEVRLFALLPGQHAKRLHSPLNNNSVNRFALYFRIKLRIHYATDISAFSQPHQRSSREGAQN